jgi:hypothetical protein
MSLKHSSERESTIAAVLRFFGMNRDGRTYPPDTSLQVALVILSVIGLLVFLFAGPGSLRQISLTVFAVCCGTAIGSLIRGRRLRRKSN